MNNIEITNMTLADIEELAKVYTIDFANTWKFSMLKEEVINPSSKCIVAKIDCEIVGFACVLISVDDACITNIVVKNSYRNMGIGSQLLEALIDITKNEKKSSLTLEVNTKNINAQKLYTKYNFKNLGIRKKYYNGVDDAYIMTLYL